MRATREQFGWNCPTCGRLVPRQTSTCQCGFRQNAHDSVTAGEPSRTRLVVVVLVGVAALGARSFFAPIDLPVASSAPATASTVVPAAIRDAGAATKRSELLQADTDRRAESPERREGRAPDRRHRADQDRRRGQPSQQRVKDRDRREERRRGRWFSFLPFVD
jgi:hypothetical protein